MVLSITRHIGILGNRLQQIINLGQKEFFTRHRILLSQYFHSLNRLFRKQIETKMNDIQIFVSCTHNGDRMQTMFTKFYFSYMLFPLR